MDAEGGEKIDLFTGFLGALIVDAELRNVPKEPYYNFDDDCLYAFKRIQGVPTEAPLDGSSLDQAYKIWTQTPRGMLEAILDSVGVSLPTDYMQDEVITCYQSERYKNEDGSPGEVLYFRYIPPTNFKVDPTEDID